MLRDRAMSVDPIQPASSVGLITRNLESAMKSQGHARAHRNGRLSEGSIWVHASKRSEDQRRGGIKSNE